VRVGLACPYSLDVPGGVQNHVRDLAAVLDRRGYDVSVLAPGEDSTGLPAYVETVGKAVPVPYNGSVARRGVGPRGADSPVAGQRAVRRAACA
jgi:phosphatidylinositol alpha-mannosyltransferase